MKATRKLLDYYDAVANEPTVKLAIPITDRPTEKARAIVLPAPEPDPLFAFAKRDSFAARAFLARLHDHQRRRALFSDVASERVEVEAWT